MDDRDETLDERVAAEVVEGLGDLDDTPLGLDDDELWDAFHGVVTMTSRELSEWLRTRAAGTETEALPGTGGSETGHRVVAVLGKRKTDLTAEDREVMEHVVRSVRAQRGEDLEPTAGEPAWRHALMDLGHDPLKPIA